MSDRTLIELGAEFNEKVAEEARLLFDQEIAEEALFAHGGTAEEFDDLVPPVDVGVLPIAERIAAVSARTPAGLSVKARVINYMLEHADSEVPWITASLLMDLRHLNILPPAAGRVVPIATPRLLVKLVQDDILQLAA